MRPPGVPGKVLDHHALIQDHVESGCLRAGGAVHVDDALLHPYSTDPDCQGIIDHRCHELGAAKNIDHINTDLNITKRWIGFFAQDPVDHRIDGENPVAGALKIGSDPMAWTRSVWTQAHDRDGVSRAEDTVNHTG